MSIFRIWALILSINAFSLGAISPIKDVPLLFSATYQFYEYGSLLNEFRSDKFKRPVNWSTFAIHGFYDWRTPSGIPPIASSLILAGLTIYELFGKHCTNKQKPPKIQKKSDKKQNWIQHGKFLMALPVALFWSRMVGSMGNNTVAYCMKNLIAPTSLYLAFSAIGTTTKHLFDHVFLHRVKKARPSHS